MKRKPLGYVFLACWIGMTTIIVINKWDVPVLWWLAFTFGLVGIVSGLNWLWEVE